MLCFDLSPEEEVVVTWVAVGWSREAKVYPSFPFSDCLVLK